MRRPWTAERTVTREQVEALIARQFPALSPVTVEPMGVGWDNTAYLVNERVVFRFPRRTVALELLECETRVLDNLVGTLPVAIPEPRYIGQGCDEFEWPFVGYDRLPGETADRINPSEHERLVLAPQIATALRTLHDIGADAALALGAPLDNFGRLDVAQKSIEMTERLANFASRGLLASVAPFRAIMDATLALATGSREASEPLALVHGDLYARHLLLDERERDTLTGIIDWGDVHVGEPGLDLSIAFTFLPERAREEFFVAYGDVSERQRLVAIYRALLSATGMTAYGDDAGDQPLLREGQSALELLARVEI